MKVKLIQVTQNLIDVMWTAARTCYSAKSPIEMWDETRDEPKEEYKEEIENKRWNLVKKVLDSGHQSIAEHVYFTFAIEGISRACSHQLVRHRAGIVFSQQSQRYVEIKEDVFNLLRWEEAKPILDKYFIDVNTSNWQEYLDCLKHYLHHIQMGMKAEDARNVLPNATKTNITVSVNFRELIHMCNLRLCTRAQKEIRDLHKLMKDEVKKVDERLAFYLVPQCEVHNICFEDKCCGKKPQISDVMNNYNAMGSLIKVKEADDALSADDFELLKESMKNPHFNEKLAKFLKEPTVFDDYNDMCKELQELRENMQQNSWERDEND